MTRRILEAFFRHKFLLLLPAFLIPAIVTPVAFATLPPLYDTSVSIWVENPAYLNINASSGFGTPVQAQAARLAELLQTRAFMTDVAGRTSLAPLVGSPAGEARIADLITKGVVVGGAGAPGTSEHLLVLHVQLPSAQLSYELCTAIIAAYQDKAAADQSDQASVAVAFYQSQVQTAQQQANQASQNLRRYVATQQATSSDVSDPTQLNLPATMVDPKLGQLQTSLQVAQAQVNNAQDALTKAQQQSLAASQGQELGFQVLDPATRPAAPIPQTKKIVIYPIGAAVVGLGLSGMLLVLFVASDRSARADSDLPAGVRVLGSVPTLRLKRVPKALRKSATRRAIGATAGMALPAPGGTK